MNTSTLIIHKVVKSSLMKSIGYRAGNLEVVFNNNSIYRYYFIGKRYYRGLLRAKSAGKYFSKRIRDQFPFRRLN